MIKQVTRVDYRDINNMGIGISIPFNGSGVFNTTYSTKEQLKNNLINLILTTKGERIENPEFGTNLYLLLFEPNIDNIKVFIKEYITESVSKFLPEIRLMDIISELNENSIYVNIKYQIKLSGLIDEITLEI